MLPVLEQALPLRDMQRDLIGNVTTIVLGATGCYLMGAPNLTVLAAILGPQFLLNKLSEQIASLKVVQQLYSKLESVPRIKTVVDFTMTMTGATKDLTLLALAPFTAQWTAPGRGELAQILVLSGLASGISNLLEMGISALNQTERNPSRKTAFGIGIQMVLGNIAARLPDFTEQLSPEWADWLKEMAYDLPKLSFITNGLSEPYEEGYTPIEELCKEFDTLLELHGKGPKRVKKEYRKLAQGIRSNNAADKRKAEANAATKAARELWKTVSSTDTTPARPISSYELGEAFYKAAQASHEASPEGIDEKFRQLDMCKDAASREYIIQTIYDAMASGVSDFRETMGSYSQFETLMTLIHYMKRSRSEA